MKRYPSGLITADPIALTASGGYSVSSIDQLQYNFSGAWFLPPFPTYGNLLKYNTYYNDKTDYLGIPARSEITTFPGDFTLECWVFPTDNTPDYAAIFDARQDGQSPAAFVFSIDPLASPVSGSWRMSYYNGTSYYGSGITVLKNQWSHLAWVRIGSTMTFYVNGVSAGAVTISGTQTASATSNPVIIGSKDSGLSGYGYIGYISNFRITNDQAAYTGNFTVPTSPLAISQSSSTNVASIINTIPANGGSVFFDGSGDSLSVPINTAFQMGTGDFTLECWVKIRSSGSDMVCIDLRNGHPTVAPLLYLVSGQVRYYVNGDAKISGATLNTLTWYHLAVVRSSGVTTLYVNGTASGSTYADTNNYILAGAVLGKFHDSDAGYLNGYLNNVRIVKGTALYTASFTPSTSQLTAVSGTSLLTCQAPTIIDNSVNAFTITVNGDTRVALSDSPFGFSNVKLLTAQSNTFTDSSLNNFTITNSGTLVTDFNPFDQIAGAYLAVAGGGGGGGQGGGGGAGGLLYRTNLIIAPNVTYTITVGAGAASASPGSSFGSNSRITTAGFAANIIAVGGGAGQSRDVGVPGGVGGSGGGGGGGASGGDAAGKAGIPGQGNPGAPGGFPSGGGGGGGAGGAGIGGSPYGGNGGIGVYLTISGSNVAYAGGGGGGGVGGYDSGGGAGGIGGGGGGKHGTTGGGGFSGGTFSTTAAPGTHGPGAINTGGGGGGSNSYLGGSGIVILRANGYAAANVTGNPNVTYNFDDSTATYRFWQSGTIRW